MRKGRKFREYSKDIIGTWSNQRADRIKLQRDGIVEWKEREQLVWGRLQEWPVTLVQVNAAAEQQGFFRDQATY